MEEWRAARRGTRHRGCASGARHSHSVVVVRNAELPRRAHRLDKAARGAGSRDRHAQPPSRQLRRARRQQLRSNAGDRETLLALGPLISQKANQVPRAANVRSIISNFSKLHFFCFTYISTTWSCCKELKKMNPMPSYLVLYLLPIGISSWDQPPIPMEATVCSTSPLLFRINIFDTHLNVLLVT